MTGRSDDTVHGVSGPGNAGYGCGLVRSERRAGSKRRVHDVRRDEGVIAVAAVEGDSDGSLFEAEDLRCRPTIRGQRDCLTRVEESLRCAGDVVEASAVGERGADGLCEGTPVKGGLLLCHRCGDGPFVEVDADVALVER